jgi:ankyrin repeat protein
MAPQSHENTKTRRIVCQASLCLLVSVCPALAEDLRLAEAARRGDTAAVRALLDQRVDVNAPEPDGTTPIHWTVYRDDLDMTTLLIQRGANVNAANELAVTPIALACTNGNARIVEALLKGGAHPSSNAADSLPPIMLCARSGSVDAVRALLARKVDVNAREPLRAQSALMWAVAQKHAAVVRLLLQQGADFRARSAATPRTVNRADPNDIYTAVIGDVPYGGSTALLFAARNGDVESARLLMDAGADVNDAAADGTSALVTAVHSGHRDVAAVLLARGANANATGAGYTALHAAVLSGDIVLVRELLAHGAVVDAPISHGTTTIRASRNLVLPENLVGASAFLLAAKFLEVDIMRLLASSGADPGRTLNDGTTALMLAAGVLSQGPLFDRRGRIALLGASDEDAAVQAVGLTFDLGGNVRAASAQGDTALHGAAARGYGAIAKLLLDRGAPRDVRNRKGATPLDVASVTAVKDVLATLRP